MRAEEVISTPTFSTHKASLIPSEESLRLYWVNRMMATVLLLY